MSIGQPGNPTSFPPPGGFFSLTRADLSRVVLFRKSAARKKGSLMLSQLQPNSFNAAPVRVILAAALVGALAVAPAAAQNVANGAGTESEGGAAATLRPEVGSILDRQIAQQEVDVLKERNLRDIRRLAILVNNYADVEGAKADFEKLKESYRKSMESYYLRRYITAQQGHRETATLADALYKKFTERFQRQLSEILTQCSRQIVDVQMAQSIEPGQQPAREERRRVEGSALKIELAYRQSVIASDLIQDDRFDAAIEHLRIARSYAIGALADMQADPAKRQEIRQRYRVDLLDAQGLTADTAAQNGGPSS
jgi:hypothetical protein